MNNPDSWFISPEDRNKHDAQFQSLKPANGYISGEQAKNFFLKSQLPTQVLGQIWGLADLDKDGRMDRKEFSIAMFLIKKRLEGAQIPAALPNSLKMESLPSTSMPQGVYPSMSSGMTSMPTFGMPMTMAYSQNGNFSSYPPTAAPGMIPPMSMQAPSHSTASMQMPMTASPGITTSTGNVPRCDWTISQQSKPRYRLQFNQQDRTKRGYLNGVEAKGVLVQSGLPQHILAQIWNLADFDHDGNLTFEEFCIAMYMVEQARLGIPLPATLPASLHPSVIASNSSTAGNAGGFAQGQRGSISGTNAGSAADKNSEDSALKSVTIEDKRRENFLKGQAELEKRQALLREQLKKEEDARLAAERAEHERKERIRLEKEAARQKEIDRQMEKQRAIEAEREAERIRIEEEKEKARRELQKQKLIEAERKRMDSAHLEKSREQTSIEQAKARRTKLEEEMQNLEKQKKDFLKEASSESESLMSVKGSIESMRKQRDEYDSNLRDTEAMVEAAKAELNHWQREREKMSLRLQTSAEGDPVTEQCKALRANIEMKKSSIEDLKRQITTQDKDMTKKGQELASKRNKVQDFDKKLQRLIVDVKSSQTAVSVKMDEWHKYKSTSSSASLNLMKPQSNAFSAKLDSTLWGNTPAVTTEKSYYRAIYDFNARQTDELNFASGNIIVVDPNNQPYQPTDGWLCGEINGSHGLFPDSYVQPCDPPATTSTYISTPEDGEVYDTIMGATAAPSYGVATVTETAAATGPATNLHSNFMSIFSPNNKANGPTASGGTSQMSDPFAEDVYAFPDKVTSSSKVEFCVALYQYNSGEQGDLILQAGDIIVIDSVDQDWWQGSVLGTTTKGLFPANFVKKMTLKEMEASGIDVSAARDLVNSMDSQSASFASPSQPASASVPLASSNSPAILQQSHPPAAVTTEADENNVYANLDDVIPPAQSTPQEEPPSLPSGTVEPISSSLINPGASQAVTTTKSAAKPEIATVIAPYTASGVEQLSLVPGQLIQIRKRSNTGWWEGELQQRGQKRRIGWFPADFVRVINSEGGGSQTSSRPSSRAKTETMEQVTALYHYAAQNVDELTFEKGSLITVISRDEPEWWRGRLANGKEGLFPVNYVRRIVQGGSGTANSSIGSDSATISVEGLQFDVVLTHKEKSRQYYIHELITTEKAYYNDLREVYQRFYKPFLSSEEITEEEVNKLFINWNDLLPKSYNFYVALKIRKDNTGERQPIQCIGDILISNFPHFLIYVRFCSCQNAAINLLQKKLTFNPKFKELCQQCEQNTRSKMMPFSSYLLKPMQRITKYKLLVENILKYTDEYHPDRGDLEEATASARSLCEAVNDGIREQENSERLEWLQEHVSCEGLNEKLYFNSNTNSLGHRRLLKYGALFKVKSNREIIAFLFNDFLLLTTPTYHTGGQQFMFPTELSNKSKMNFKLYKKPILLNSVIITPGLPNSESNQDVFTIKDLEYIQSFRAMSTSDRDKWLDILQSSSRDYLEQEKSIKMRTMSFNRYAGIGRLLVTIVEGINLKVGSVAGDAPCNKKSGKCDPYCEVSLGNKTLKTKVATATLSPKWNANMQFDVKNIQQDVLCISIYDKDYFSPNDFLGRTELPVREIFEEQQVRPGLLEKRLKLSEVETGEILVKLDVKLYETTADNHYSNQQPQSVAAS